MSTATDSVTAFFDGSTAVIWGYVRKNGGAAGEVVGAVFSIVNGGISSTIQFFGNPTEEQATALIRK